MTGSKITYDSPCCCNGQGCRCTPSGEEQPALFTATSALTTKNHLDHFLARAGVRRSDHRVEPGLYRLGTPDENSPVFASANYTLSFDALRESLAGIDCYILVLDTKGINVWCAAGKGTFGTDELARRIGSSGLPDIVGHRKVILPQLGAPGVSWPEVMRRTGFKVEYGPVRARDIPEYLRTGRATPAMRRVGFPLWGRLVLTPVEFRHAALPMVIAAAVLYLLSGTGAALAAIIAVLAGTVLFPLLLPIIPTRDFSSKGLILGGFVAIPFAAAFAIAPALPSWANVLAALAALLLIPAVTAYLALNFTGCSTFASRSGVKREIFCYIPAMAMMVGAGTAVLILLGISRLLGVI